MVETDRKSVHNRDEMQGNDPWRKKSMKTDVKKGYAVGRGDAGAKSHRCVRKKKWYVDRGGV